MDTLRLSLQDVITIALDKSYTMKSNHLLVAQARETLNSTRARLQPSIMMNFKLPSYDKSFTEIQQGYGFSIYNTHTSQTVQGDLQISQRLPTNGTLSLTSSLYHREQSYLTYRDTDTTARSFHSSVRVSVNQPLFSFNTIRHDLHNARLSYEKSEHAYQRSRLELVNQVTSKFYNLYQAQRGVEIQSEDTRRQEESYQLAQRKFQAGLIPEVEALQSEVNLALSRNSLLQAERNLKSQSEDFKQYIGLELNQLIGLTVDLSYQPVEIDTLLVLRHGLANRTEIRDMQIDSIIRAVNVRQIDAQWQINGNLSAYYDLSGYSSDDLKENNLERLFRSSWEDMKDRPKNKGFTFTLSVPVWDGGVNRAAVNAAKMALTQTEYNQINQRINIVREIRSAIDAVHGAYARLEILKRSGEIAGKSYDISLHRFKNGDITAWELAEGLNKLTSAQTSFLDAFVAYRMALNDLRMKTMYDFEHHQSIVE